MKEIKYDSTGRMIVYCWEDSNTPGECKFGERWVTLGLDIEKSVLFRIRQSLGVRKDIFDQGDITLIAWWDVSKYAKRVNKCYPRARMDDHLRSFIGYRKNSTGEVHLLSGLDMKFKVNQLLTKLNQKLIDVKLSTKQYQVAEEVIEMFETNQIILAELCARFGKTIWSAAIGVELDVDLIIVSSYVGSVFASFANDLTSYNQFSQYKHIDANDLNFEDQIQNAFDNKQKVIVYLSLCNSKKRDYKIEHLLSLTDSTLLIIDEADFGAHQPKQALPLIEGVGNKIKTIIMTGTNSDRAVTYWKLDKMISVTYPELLIQKKESSFK